MDEGAEPNDFEIRDALLLAALGKQIRFLKPSGNGPRTADALINGKRVEIKNPTLNNENTIRNQILNCLYGRDRGTIKLQSGNILISNVRNKMTMEEMEQGLARAYIGPDPLSDVEKTYVKSVLLFDTEHEVLRIYGMK